MERTSGDRTFIAGDALRALAALSVLVFHVWVAVAQTTGYDFGPFADVALHLNAGLYVFFVLSGYLVGGPFVRAWLRGGPWPSAGRYAVKRVRRIVPAFWLVLVGLLLWFGTFGSSPREVLALFLFAQNLDPGAVQRVVPQGWTLGIEMSFYLALPLLAYGATALRGFPSSAAVRSRLLWLGLFVVAVAGLWLRSRYSKDNDPQANLATLGWAFVPGMALAAVEATGLRQRVGRRAAALALLGFGLACFAALVVVNPALGDGLTNVLYFGCGGGLVGGALAWQWATGRAPRVADNRVAHALGRWSYGIYLLHVGVGLELLRHVPGGAGPWAMLLFLLVGMVVVSTVLAAALWWLVEEPAMTGRAAGRPPWWPAPTAPHMTVPEADAKGIFVAGDALRGLGCVLVVAAHSWFGVTLLYRADADAALGPIGPMLSSFWPIVDMFFALSAFLVAGPFVRAWLGDRPWPKLGRYTTRRLLRIVPAFWVVCGAYLLWRGAAGGDALNVLYLFTFLQSIDPTGVGSYMAQGWTLGVEMGFYLAIPLVALVLSRRGTGTRRARQRMVLGLCAVMVVAGIVLRAQWEVSTFGGRNTFSLLHVFAPGLALAAYEKELRARFAGTRRGRHIADALLVAAAAAWAVIILTDTVDGQPLAEACATVISFGLVAGLLLRQWSTLDAPRLLDNPAAHALGRWSYGIYLIHLGIVVELANRVPPGMGLTQGFLFVFLGALLVSTMLAAVLFWLVEEPAMRRSRPRPVWHELRAVSKRPRPPAADDPGTAANPQKPAPAAVA